MYSDLSQWVEGAAKPANVGITHSGNVPYVAIYNAIISDDSLRAIAFNDMTLCPCINGLVPWEDESAMRPWSDSDTRELRLYLSAKLCKSLNARDVFDAAMICARRNHFNPLHDTLNNLPSWDGEARAQTLFVDFLGAAHTEYTRAVSSLLLHGAVMRAFEPGCKFDFVPVLYGAQGIGKSSFLSLLSLDKGFFTDNIGKLSSERKDTQERLAGKWFVELSELSSMKSARSNEEVKQFITSQSDNFREPYAAAASEHPRRCVLVGTSNTGEFIADHTGGRRFLPIRCDANQIKISPWSDAARAHMVQAWAEVMQEYRRLGRFDLTLPDSVQEFARDAQQQSTVEDARVGFVIEYCSHHTDELICALRLLEAYDADRNNKTQQADFRLIMQSHLPAYGWHDAGRRLTCFGADGEKLGQQRCFYHETNPNFSEF